MAREDFPEIPGLSSREAQTRLAEFGPNEIRGRKIISPFLLFLDQLRSPLVLILVGTCLLSVTLGERLEAVAIGAIVLLNATIGFIQEFRAETAIAALRRITAPRASVFRDGVKRVITAREVVPGDFVYLESGDLVAADGEILKASDLQINESVLTGESLPVEKTDEFTPGSAEEATRYRQVFMGTSVVKGSAVVRMTETGMNTQLGKIAGLMSGAQTHATPLQVQLRQVGLILLLICLGIIGIVFLFGVAEGRTWSEQIVFSISLAVAVVPEGMPAIVTVALAVGVQRMALRNALVRKLPSVETIGSVSVICTDKTGTLTTGEMRVREIWGEDHDRVILSAASCCEAEVDRIQGAQTGDPTEIAILLEALERGIDKAAIEAENPRLKVHSFDAHRKLMSIYRSDHNLYVKGAFDKIASLCGRTPALRMKEAASAHAEMASRGLRIIAVARGQTREEHDLDLLGLLAIADPPRTEVIEAIREARAAGILPVMITGDHPATAVAIARELELISASEDPAERVYARVTPEEKLGLIRQWKEKGAVVAMIGDGVNDAPALGEAHVGIAMGLKGTEVSREAADIILADDNFATIIAAVREGRGVYLNIRKAITYLLTGNMGELVVVLGASVLGLPLPFQALHLLWINLVTDALPALALIADPVPPDILKHKPRPRLEPLLRQSEWKRIFFTGSLEAMLVLGLFKWALEDRGVEQARNLAFTLIVFSQMFRSFGARSRTHSLWQVGFLSNLWLLGVVVMTLVLQTSLHHLRLGQVVFNLSPLSREDLILVMLLALIPITVIELEKYLRCHLKQASYQ